MRKIILFISTLFLFLTSCDGYEKYPVSPDYISSLNKTVSEEHSKGAVWTNSPGEIVKHLYSTESNPRYKTKSKSASACKLTVESGPADDELLGERYTLYFRPTEIVWIVFFSSLRAITVNQKVQNNIQLFYWLLSSLNEIKSLN
jgi:hypothetical protein